MVLQSKAHPGYPYSSELHEWTACASNVSLASRDAPEYYWYQVAACANAAKDTNATFDTCLTKVPAAAVQPVHECLADAPRVAALVKTMHTIGDSFGDYPTVLINGKQSPRVPEPDMHGDKVGPLLAELCHQAKAHGVAPLPAAC